MPDVLKQFAIGSSTLTDLGDVTVSTPALGHVLYYDGAGWVNATKATAKSASSAIIIEIPILLPMLRTSPNTAAASLRKFGASVA